MEEAPRPLRRLLLRVAVFGHLASVLVVWAGVYFFAERTRATFFLLYLPRLPYAAVGILLLPLAFLSKQRALVAAEIAALLVALFPLMGLRLGFAHKPHGTSLKLLTYNVFYARLDQAVLTREISTSKADLIVLQASRSSYAAKLHEAMPDWTFQVDDEFVLITKLKIRETFPFEDPKQAWIRYALEGPNGPFQLVNVHPTSARGGLYDREDPSIATELRTHQLQGATAAAARSNDPVLIAGDTNVPGLSALGRTYFSQYHDAFDDVGFGLGYTFPAKLPWMRIDRVLGGPRVRFLDAHVLPRGASDHLAVVVDFEIASLGTSP